jgi:hypothetical protein
MIEICRDHSTKAKRWRDGQMALRQCAAPLDYNREDVAETSPDRQRTKLRTSSGELGY